MKLRGLKATKPGISTSSRDIQDFVTHSSCNTLKIFKQGSKKGTIIGGPFGVGGAGFSEDINHGLGYKPIVRAYGKLDSDRKWNLLAYKEGRNDSGVWWMSGGWRHLTDNKIRVWLEADPFNPPATDQGAKFKYYIMIDPRKEAWYESASISPSPSVETYKGTEGKAVMKASRLGYDVHTAEDKDLVFSSKRDMFKIYRVMYFSGAGNDYHGLEYAPTFDYFTEYDTDKWKEGNDNYFLNYASLVCVDDTKVYVKEKCYVILYVDPLDT